MAQSKLSKAMQTQEVQSPVDVCLACIHLEKCVNGTLADECKEKYDSDSVSEGVERIDENIAWLRFICTNLCKIEKTGIYKGDFAVAIAKMHQQILQLTEDKKKLNNQLEQQDKPEKNTIPNRNVGKKNVSESEVGDLVRAMAADGYTANDIAAETHWSKSTIKRLINRDKIICKEFSKRIEGQNLSDEETQVQLQKIADKVGISVAEVIAIVKETKEKSVN